MVWLIGTCYEGSESRCEERVSERYGYETFVMLGMRTKCRRNDWPSVTIEDYVLWPGYIFVNMPSTEHRIDSFKEYTRISDFLRSSPGGAYYEVQDWIMTELFLLQASGEFSDWRGAAIKYFKGRIGTTVKLPAEHRFGGVHVTVTDVVGDNLHWRFEIMGHVTTGVVKLAKMWPKNHKAQEYASILALSSDLNLYLKTGDQPEEKSLKLPRPPLDSMA